MKDVILIELANKWIAEAAIPEHDLPQTLSSKDNEMLLSIKEGQREARRECADTLIVLIQVLGEK